MKSSLQPASAMRRRNALRRPCEAQWDRPASSQRSTEPIAKPGRCKRLAVLVTRNVFDADHVGVAMTVAASGGATGMFDAALFLRGLNDNRPLRSCGGPSATMSVRRSRGEEHEVDASRA